MLVEPTFEQLLKLGKIDHAPHIVDFIARDVKIGRVIVTVKILALAAMLVQPVAGAKLDPPHDGETHGGIPGCRMRDAGGGVVAAYGSAPPSLFSCLKV